MPDHDVLIVGAGLSGLACALELEANGAKVLVLEGSDDVGGRVRTDSHDGFLMDRGFQVILEAYPECRRVLDYDALDLCPFYPGAEIWTGRSFARFADPYRRPQDAMATLRSSIGTVPDKMRITKLRKEALSGTPESILVGPDRSALEDLQEFGFTPGMIQGFFRPFFGGVLLNPDLTDSSRIFRYIFRMFSEGNISVPRKGMGEIPRQLANRLPQDAIRLNSRVSVVRPGKVDLESGEGLAAEAVVVATEGPEAARLVGLPDPGSKATTCLYFRVPEPPVEGPMLVLDGTGRGPANNLVVLSQVSPGYAPPGDHLVSVSCLGTGAAELQEIEADVRLQLADWYGPQVETWSHLRTYRIPHAQPRQDPGTLDPPHRGVTLEARLYVCGDHRETASLQGALHSGRRAAEAILADSAAGTLSFSPKRTQRAPDGQDPGAGGPSPNQENH